MGSTGELVGRSDGKEVGENVGCSVGSTGELVGVDEGRSVGENEGSAVGEMGELVGLSEGLEVGKGLGSSVGATGELVGLSVGCLEGSFVGASLGSLVVGAAVGTGVVDVPPYSFAPTSAAVPTGLDPPKKSTGTEKVPGPNVEVAKSIAGLPCCRRKSASS